MIYLHLSPESEVNGLGCSRLFGYPDLLPDMDIPTIVEDGEPYGLTFICQINLADIPAEAWTDEARRFLPGDGLLLFFADISFYRGDWDEPGISMHPSDNKVVHVLYIPADRFGELEYTRRFYFEQDEPEAIPLVINNIPPTNDEPKLQLLGTTDALEWSDWPEPCEGWKLLFVMDSMETEEVTYNFVDWGELCFLCPEADLLNRDFSNVRAIILSS